MAPVDDRKVTVDRLRDTIELLESIAADREVLAGVPDVERRRLLQAVALVYSPDRVERRRMSKIAARQRKAARVSGDQHALHDTGIRTQRRKPVYHTPNVFPSVSVTDGFAPNDVHAPGTRELGNSGTRELGNSGTPELGNSGTPELRNSGTPELRNSGTPELRNSGTPELRNSSTATSASRSIERSITSTTSSVRTAQR